MLIQRDAELQRLDDLLAAAGEGRGAVLLVEGDPGMGKSALVAAARDKAAKDGFATLRASGGELETDLAFGILRQLLERTLAGIAPTQRREVLSGAARLAAPVLDLAPGSDEQAIGAVAHGFYWVCSNLAESRPLLLAVDDAHWCDEPSLGVLSHLARRMEDLPALLIIAVRTNRAGREAVGRLLSGVSYEAFSLQPLSEESVAVLVRRALSPLAEPEFCRACAHATGGNPFLLHEALTALRADGVAPVAAEAERVAALHTETISRTLLARLARLGPDAARLARAVAVLGPEAELRRVSRLAGLGADAAGAAWDALAGEGVLGRDRPLRFQHPLVRTAVYDDAGPARRAAEHRFAARVLHDEGVPPDRLAPHLLATEPAADPWVVDTLREAADRALTQGAPEPAVTFLLRAQAEPPAPDVDGDLLFRLGGALLRANRPVEAGAAWAEALAAATRPELRVEVAMELSQFLALAGRGEEAVAILDEARSLIDDPRSGLALRLEAVAGTVTLGAIRPTRGWTERVAALVPELDGTGPEERALLAVLAFTWAATGERPAGKVARTATRAIAPTDAHRAMTVNVASAALAVADRYDDALDVLDLGIAAARRRGDAVELAYLSVMRSHAAYEAGRLPDAEADGRFALDLLKDHPELAFLSLGVVIDVLVERGSVDEAQHLLARHGGEQEHPMNLISTHLFHMARARLRLAQGRVKDALSDLGTCGEAMSDAGYVNPSFAPWRAESALAHHTLGETDVARRLAERDLELARRFGAPRGIGIALRVSGLIERGDEGLSRLDEAVDVLQGSSAPLELARALVDQGAALRRAGRRQAARDRLREGLDGATRSGATPLAERARAELVTSGARPRRQLLTGLGSLTASELRVVRLAAEGHTNREIAQALFVSRRTVEVHLTNAYRKLQINDRRALAEVLAGRS